MKLHYINDSTTNDSDKEFVVPTGRTWEFSIVWINLITTATVGNRQIVLEIQDDSNAVVYRRNASATQAASLNVNYLYAENDASNPIPHAITMLPGWGLRIYDSAAVAPAADDLTVRCLVKERVLNGN